MHMNTYPLIIIFDLFQVIRRLRDFNEPILLFGESEYDAFVRLKRLESAEPDFSKVCHKNFH